jgi:hypothetical protein
MPNIYFRAHKYSNTVLQATGLSGLENYPFHAPNRHGANLQVWMDIVRRPHRIGELRMEMLESDHSCKSGHLVLCRRRIIPAGAILMC